MIEDRPTLIYFVQTVLNTFKRDQEVEYSRDRQYAIELLEKAMEHQNDIWNAAIEEAASSIKDKFDKHGWNYHLPSVGREVENEIGKLKK